ncbi:MAG: hypothetical protein CMJ80_15405 [Planctomycetaceae bacterium]|nr:hypothetical protein [Planctomycetaceae bacterium]
MSAAKRTKRWPRDQTGASHFGDSSSILAKPIFGEPLSVTLTIQNLPLSSDGTVFELALQ